MITCPACGKDNQDSAVECRRCRAPLREELPEEALAEPAPAAAAEPEASSDSLGTVCGRCEAYNEPGVRVCTACGYHLLSPAPSAEAEPPIDKTPAHPFAPPMHLEAPDATPQDGPASLSAELRALAISDEEAAEAGMSTSGNGVEPSLDKTPPHPFTPPELSHAEPMHAEPRARPVEVAAAVAGSAAGITGARRAPPAEPPPRAPEPVTGSAEKLCPSCGAANPPAARFCFECGTPFAKKPAQPEPRPDPPAKRPEPEKMPPRQPPPPPSPAPHVEPIKAEPSPSIEVAPSIELDAAFEAETTAEMAAGSVDPTLPEDATPASAPSEEPLPEETPFAAAADPGEPLPEELPAEEALAFEPIPEPAQEAPAPFQASLIVERGTAPGTAFTLAWLENSVGSAGAHVELSEDPFIAPRAATLFFAEDHLAVRDEGSANGVFLKVRESAPLEAGDHFVAGERLFRYDGPVDLARNGDGAPPFLGAPRPQGNIVRVCEVLSSGKAGRTCHRAGPVIAIGRTGCDMNFPSDSLLAARHAEIRLGEDGTATLVDLGQGPSGVFVRVRAQGQQDLQAGDVLQIGEQLLRLEVV